MGTEMTEIPEFPTVNRSLVVIRKKQPYVDWANALPDRSENEIKNPITVDEINREPAAYLIPEILDDRDLDAYLDSMWIILFEMLLADWSLEPNWWPKKRSRKMFNNWFEISLHTMVYDMWGREPLDYTD